MSDRIQLNHERHCQRCFLPTHDVSDLREGWCGFCRAFAGEGHVGEVPVYRLTADKQVVQCMPSEVGNWQSTGRQAVAYSTLYLPRRVQVWLQTTFLPVDYWPEGPVPLLFESKLSHMHRDKVFDVFTQRYASYAEAHLGHMSIFEKLLSKSATVA